MVEGARRAEPVESEHDIGLRDTALTIESVMLKHGLWDTEPGGRQPDGQQLTDDDLDTITDAFADQLRVALEGQDRAEHAIRLTVMDVLAACLASLAGDQHDGGDPGGRLPGLHQLVARYGGPAYSDEDLKAIIDHGRDHLRRRSDCGGGSFL